MDPRGNAFLGTDGGFGSRLTLTGWILVGAYGGVLGLTLFLENWFDVPVYRALSLSPLGDPAYNLLHQPWTLITHHFLHPPTSVVDTVAGLVVVFVIAAVVEAMRGRFGKRYPGVFFTLALVAILLVLFLVPRLSQALSGFPTTLLFFYFFSGPVERYLGTRRFITYWALAALGGVILGQPLSLVYGLDQPFVGPMPGLMGLIVLFGLAYREARILLMLVLPVKGVWIAAITAIMAVLALLAKFNPAAGYWCGAIAVAFFFYKGWLDLLDFKILQLRLREYRLKRKLKRFRVIEGGRGDDGPDDGPVYH